MSDIVEMLRARAEQEFEMLGNIHLPLQEAADEIEELRNKVAQACDEVTRLREQLRNAIWVDSEHCKAVEADNDRLRDALHEIVKPGGAGDFWQCVEIARAALEGK